MWLASDSIDWIASTRQIPGDNLPREVLAALSETRLSLVCCSIKAFLAVFKAPGVSTERIIEHVHDKFASSGGSAMTPLSRSDLPTSGVLVIAWTSRGLHLQRFALCRSSCRLAVAWQGLRP
mmetsp:Transcript_40861/g.129433  ORF Transcript_40861/g.129433 Transcript_40861/m.129433 type:complete len:122 (-) Transcript_40861:196-561(-)